MPVSISRPVRGAGSVVHSYTALADEARRRGLHRRSGLFYGCLLASLLAVLALTMVGLVVLGPSWLQLLTAGVLGITLTQLAFLAHEAAHRQVLTSGPANDRLGWLVSVVFVGVSYSWWMNKHTRHHANPNKVGKDPDIEPGVLLFHPPDSRPSDRPRIARWVRARQGVFFFPLLLLEGVNLHGKSVRHLWMDRGSRGPQGELAVLVIRLTGYVVTLFWLLPAGLAAAFLAVQLAVFGLYLGAAFAPNHIAMPIVDRTQKLDYFTRQVRSSRNVTGGWWATALLGGLNYQIEHHLFPSMPRTHLAAARRIVRQHCASLDVAYTETDLIAAWGIVIRHLDHVGLAAGRTFHCPTAQQFR